MSALKLNNEISLLNKGMTDKSPSSSTMTEIYHLIIGNYLHDSTEKSPLLPPVPFAKADIGKRIWSDLQGNAWSTFDNLPHEQLLLAMELLKKDPYVELSYITISANFEPDNNCKDITCCSIFIEDSNAYFNPEAEMFHIKLPSEKEIEKTQKSPGILVRSTLRMLYRQYRLS